MALGIAAASSDGATQPSRLRLATYNIQNLTAESARTGDRIEKLRKIVADIGADVFALQEIADRQTAAFVFPASEWHLVIDDDSPDAQDLAIAIRKPWKPIGFDSDLDADDQHFLAPDKESESFFPNRRDGLVVTVSSPDGKASLVIVCVHAKSRRDGRSATDARREGAARVLAARIKAKFAGSPVAVMGDFNDTPDDRSLNILETGNPDAAAGPEEADGPLLTNLCEPLAVRDWASQGCKPQYVEKQTGWIDVRVPGSRARNNQMRGTDRHSGPALFDQILISPSLKSAWIPGSTDIYRKPITLEGPGFSRPSDHMPVYADFAVATPRK
jgi:exonuclease III